MQGEINRSNKHSEKYQISSFQVSCVFFLPLLIVHSLSFKLLIAHGMGLKLVAYNHKINFLINLDVRRLT